MSINFDSPIHNLLGRFIDVSLIWHLEYTADKNVYINGHRVASFIPKDTYERLQKHFFLYRKRDYEKFKRGIIIN